MKTLFFIIFLFIFNAPAFSEGTSTLVEDEHKVNEWVVSYITKNSIHASVNGKVTHGDRLNVRFVKGKCDVGNLLTFVYSYSKNPDLVNFKDKYVKTKFMGEEIIVKVLFTTPFLMGHRSTVDLGWMPKNYLEKYLTKDSLITMTYLDSEETKITEYFDITENKWDNVGLGYALEKASAMCKKL